MILGHYYHRDRGSLHAFQWAGFDAEDGPTITGITPVPGGPLGRLVCHKTGATHIIEAGMWICRLADGTLLTLNDKQFKLDCVKAQEGDIEIPDEATIDLTDPSPTRGATVEPADSAEGSEDPESGKVSDSGGNSADGSVDPEQVEGDGTQQEQESTNS